jgi:hypothetical protein
MPNIEHTPTSSTAGGPREGFYVTVFNGRQRGWLLGPYPTHGEALANIDRGAREAPEVDPRAAFYFYGTARVVADILPVGRLNARIGLYPDTVKEPA